MDTPDNHPTRQKILELLAGREMSAGAIAEALSAHRPGVSHHMAVLLARGLVQRRTERAFRYYSLKGFVDPSWPPEVSPVVAAKDTKFAAAFKRLARERGIPGTKGPD